MNAPDHPTSLDNLPRAMAWMVLSGLSFALMGAAVKLAGDVPITMKVFFKVKYCCVFGARILF